MVGVVNFWKKQRIIFIFKNNIKTNIQITILYKPAISQLMRRNKIKQQRNNSARSSNNCNSKRCISIKICCSNPSLAGERRGGVSDFCFFFGYFEIIFLIV